MNLYVWSNPFFKSLLVSPLVCSLSVLCFIHLSACPSSYLLHYSYLSLWCISLYFLPLPLYMFPRLSLSSLSPVFSIRLSVSLFSLLSVILLLTLWFSVLVLQFLTTSTLCLFLPYTCNSNSFCLTNPIRSLHLFLFASLSFFQCLSTSVCSTVFPLRLAVSMSLSVSSAIIVLLHIYIL